MMIRKGWHERLSRTITDEERRRKLQYDCTFGLLAAVCVVMTVLNVVTKKGVLTWATLIFSVLCLVNLLLTLRGGRRCAEIAAWSFVVEIVALFTFFIISGNPEGFSVIWMCMLPACGMLLFGLKRNSILCALMLGILIFFFRTPSGRALLRYDYTETFLMRFPILFVSLFLLACVLEMIRVITQSELDQLRISYEYLYAHDSLTRLLNRHGLEELEKRTKVKNSQAVLMMDVDYFKQVNDAYGHDVGDLTLARVAEAIGERMGDCCCRWGGEEFVVWFPDGGVAPADAEALRAAIEAMVIRIPNCDKCFQVTISIGGVRAGPERPLKELIAEADQCLYQAKEAGRNRVVLQGFEEISA